MKAAIAIITLVMFLGLGLYPVSDADAGPCNRDPKRCEDGR